MDHNQATPRVPNQDGSDPSSGGGLLELLDGPLELWPKVHSMFILRWCVLRLMMAILMFSYNLELSQAAGFILALFWLLKSRRPVLQNITFFMERQVDPNIERPPSDSDHSSKRVYRSFRRIEAEMAQTRTPTDPPSIVRYIPVGQC